MCPEGIYDFPGRLSLPWLHNRVKNDKASIPVGRSQIISSWPRRTTFTKGFTGAEERDVQRAQSQLDNTYFYWKTRCTRLHVTYHIFLDSSMLQNMFRGSPRKPQTPKQTFKKTFPHDLSLIPKWQASLYRQPPQHLSCRGHIFSTSLTNTTPSYSAVPEPRPHGTGSGGDVSQSLTSALLNPFWSERRLRRGPPLATLRPRWKWTEWPQAAGEKTEEEEESESGSALCLVRSNEKFLGHSGSLSWRKIDFYSSYIQHSVFF